MKAASPPRPTAAAPTFAYEKATGADVGQVFMPAPQRGSPMTSSINGTQYIAVAVSGAGFAGELLVYKLAN